MNTDLVSDVSNVTQFALVVLTVVGAVGFLATYGFQYWAKNLTMRYVHNLTKPDPRYCKSHVDKPICPYMGNVLNRKGLRVIVIPPWQWSSIKQICREQIQMQDKDNVKSAGIVVVPFLPFEKLMAIWKELRLEAIPYAKMFGEFHPQREQTGLHTDHVFPLKTPLPMFGIRAMVKQDKDFFQRFETDPKVMATFQKVFNERWGSESSPISSPVASTAPASPNSSP